MFIPEEYSTGKNPSAVHVSVPSKHRIARSFDLKAAAYDDHAAIQAGLIKQLIGKLADVDQPGGRWINLGCGTGILAQECRKAGISSRIVNIDHAFNPLCIARERHTAFVLISRQILTTCRLKKSFLMPPLQLQRSSGLIIRQTRCIK